jgi:hypothetical protein
VETGTPVVLFLNKKRNLGMGTSKVIGTVLQFFRDGVFYLTLYMRMFVVGMLFTGELVTINGVSDSCCAHVVEEEFVESALWRLRLWECDLMP